MSLFITPRRKVAAAPSMLAKSPSQEAAERAAAAVAKRKAELAAAGVTPVDKAKALVGAGVDKTKSVASDAASAVSKGMNRASTGVAGLVTAGDEARDALITKLNPFAADPGKVTGAQDSLTAAYAAQNKLRDAQRAADAKSVADRFVMPKPGETIAPEPLSALALPKPGEEVVPKALGRIVKAPAAPADYVSQPHAASKAPGLERFLTGRNAAGAGLGGLLGYGASRLMSSDENEEGLTPEERARRVASNSRRSALLSLLGAGAGGTAAHLSA